MSLSLMNLHVVVSDDVTNSCARTVNVCFTQWEHFRNITYTDYLSDLSKAFKYISFMAVDVKCMVNELETAVRATTAHSLFPVLSSICEYLMTFLPIYSVLYGVRKT